MRIKIEDFIEDDSSDQSSKNGGNNARLKKCTKSYFDRFYNLFNSVSKGQQLPALKVDTLTSMVVNTPVESIAPAVDCDQIWQQILLSCRFSEDSIKQCIQKLTGEDCDAEIEDDNESDDLEDVNDLDSELEDGEDMDDLNDIGEQDGSEEEVDMEANDGDSELSEELKFADDYQDGEEDLSENEAPGSEFENIDEHNNAPISNGEKKSVFEDDFLKIDELEAFLDQEDAKEERLMQKLENPYDFPEEANEEDEGMLDYFTNLAGGKGSKATYKDFFDDISDKRQSRKERSVRFADEDESEAKKQKLDLFGDVLNKKDSKAEIDEENLSLHEKRMLKYKQKIEEIQEQSLAEKPWQLMGEATAQNRPEDSLLAEVLQYDSSARLPPEITTEKTSSLEDIVLQRIKDKTFDDVVRKVRPKEQPFEYKKRILLEQDKNKLSLAEVYEQEFVKQVREEKVEEKNEKHEEIKELMKKVFYKLDLLSHFSLTPQTPSAEMKVISNAPALTMEEAVPVAMADSAQLAPEEIRKVKPWEVKANTERTKTDKLRQRRKKKLKQKAIAAIEAKRMDPDSKEKALLDLKKASSVKSNRNSLKIVSDSRNSGNYTGNMTSTSFFSKLNEQQNSKTKEQAKGKEDKNKSRTAAKFKL